MLAKAAGITPNMLSLIERGEGNPSWVTIKGIAAALGVSVSALAKAAEGIEKKIPEQRGSDRSTD